MGRFHGMRDNVSIDLNPQNTYSIQRGVYRKICLGDRPLIEFLTYEGVQP